MADLPSQCINCGVVAKTLGRGFISTAIVLHCGAYEMTGHCPNYQPEQHIPQEVELPPETLGHEIVVVSSGTGYEHKNIVYTAPDPEDPDITIYYYYVATTSG